MRYAVVAVVAVCVLAGACVVETRVDTSESRTPDGIRFHCRVHTWCPSTAEMPGDRIGIAPPCLEPDADYVPELTERVERYARANGCALLEPITCAPVSPLEACVIPRFESEIVWPWEWF